MSSKKNGEIDLLRFIFAIYIVLYHFSITFHKGVFTNGYIGVEFFFLVSGYLMAKHADAVLQRADKPLAIGTENWHFIIHKVRQFYKYYICAIIISVVGYEMLLQHKTIVEVFGLVFRGITSLLVIYMGAGESVFQVSGIWYLSAMIIAMFILYPIALSRFDLSVKWIFPAISLFILGYLFKTNGTLSEWSRWSGLVNYGILRAVAEISLGATLYGFVQEYSAHCSEGREPMRFPAQVLLTLLKFACYLTVLVYGWGAFRGHVFERSLDLSVLIVCALGVTLSFAHVGFCIPDCKLTRIASRFSLAIYIFHGIVRIFAVSLLGDIKLDDFRFYTLVVITVIVGVALTVITDLFFKGDRHP